MRVFSKKNCTEMQGIIVSYYVYLMRDPEDNNKKKALATLTNRAEVLFGKEFAESLPGLAKEFLDKMK